MKWAGGRLSFVVTVTHLDSSVQLELIQSIVAEVNKKTGEAECQFYRRGLIYLEDGQRLPEIQQSRFLYCHGELKNNKGQVETCGSPSFNDLMILVYNVIKQTVAFILGC